MDTTQRACATHATEVFRTYAAVSLIDSNHFTYGIKNLRKFFLTSKLRTHIFRKINKVGR